MQYPKPVTRLIESYMKLPGIGEKTATRLAFFTINMDQEDVGEFSQALQEVQTKLHYCHICGNITDQEPCEICANEQRDQTQILVVEQPKDIMALENMHSYNGLYHVLGGVLSPVNGIGPDDLRIKQLVERLQHDDLITEVIVATNATSEGEATAMYLAKLIKPAQIKVTRLAHGLAVGADIEYADQMTLQRAVDGRQQI
ncbi:recombination mediator RecR [Bombilactobacillus thymidiniphilus]|uniref:Recombination protein RecR n=1 Tax=Bombilactobacillus thymidiniphilus TaxID=2923363 RepID=A0ABY4PE46_9LACO|nr:recombination mediator RecR [Bombilactobacillus thymidiniphilus]UQS83933.1 recombination mediator RecR [Bombilactobacillus thymidiniphilus]